MLNMHLSFSTSAETYQFPIVSTEPVNWNFSDGRLDILIHTK